MNKLWWRQQKNVWECHHQHSVEMSYVAYWKKSLRITNANKRKSSTLQHTAVSAIEDSSVLLWFVTGNAKWKFFFTQVCCAGKHNFVRITHKSLQSISIKLQKRSKQKEKRSKDIKTRMFWRRVSCKKTRDPNIYY